MNIQEILGIYEQASGQKLNREKTSIYFSKNTHNDVKAHILSIVGVQVTTSFEKYLGLPALIGRSKVEAFSDLKGTIWGRMNGWKERFLSQAGKEVFVKGGYPSNPHIHDECFPIAESSV
jgi:hypothetical protein